MVLTNDHEVRAQRTQQESRTMQNRTPRSVLAISAAAALTVAALSSTAVLAKGPGAGAGGCDGDCSADQPQVQQQVRAQDGSGGGSQQRNRAREDAAQQTQTKAAAGGGQQVQARAGGGERDGQATARSQNRQAYRGNGNRNAEKAAVAVRENARQGAGKGPNEDGQRGPGTCDECDVEMGTLTEEQAAGLVFMANEEKLAHDVYSAFAELYDVPIFANIAASEARHQEAVNTTLERYGLEDTAFGLPEGEFSDPIIASLYDRLIEQGSTSLDQAIAVGVLIEETDIADLESRIVDLGGTLSDAQSAAEAELDEDVAEVAAPDVVEMYSHLLAGSQNHLSAFQGRQ
jgi:hypothetical protein